MFDKLFKLMQKSPKKQNLSMNDDRTDKDSFPDHSLPELPSEIVLSTLEFQDNIKFFAKHESEFSSAYLLLPKLNQVEGEFLQLVHDDELTLTAQFLMQHPDLNINCVNYQGLSALHLAVQNRSEQMVEFLLSQKNIDIADTVLHAVRDNQMRILKILLETQKKISPGLEFAGATHSTDFPEYMTPLILAAQCGHYEIVALLLARGHRLEKPHPPKCLCRSCQERLANDDPLHSSSERLSLYSAIASPAYLVHASRDPILTAFRLSRELVLNAAAYRQLAPAYLQLHDDVSAFAVELMGCCRTSEEVELLMRQTCGSGRRRHFIFPRLLMAVDYLQKEFVAHPNTQQVLESYWIGTWYSWRSYNVLMKAFIVIFRVFLTPVILICCLISPRSKCVKFYQIPLNKLITHASAYFVFLIVIFMISNRNRTGQKRGPPDTGAEPILILYVLGYTWSAIRMCVMQGPRRYFTELWNWGEILMLVLFFITFLLWIKSAIDIGMYDNEDLERKYWGQYDPTLLAEGTFCIATIIAYFRLMFLCQLNYHLGPLQVSLGKMTIDIYKYTIVFAIIISAFAAGLARFYQYYDGMVYEDEFGMKTVQVSSFTSLTDTLTTLFWALFCMAPIESADVVLENVRNYRNASWNGTMENRHVFTERVGFLCFACFEVVSVIVVLNMLIATMSSTFQRVTDNVATEWTFGRTEVYIDYISQTTLPSPWNMLPTAAGMSNVVDWFGILLRSPKDQKERAKCSWSYCCYIERDIDENLQKDFPALMSQLVQRYFRDKQEPASNQIAELENIKKEIINIKKMLMERDRDYKVRFQ